MVRNLAVLLIIGLTVYCLFDVLRSTDDERLGLHKAIWALLIVVVPLVGAGSWLAVRWSRRAAAGGPDQAPHRRRSTGPDDDPDFLSKLDEERRRSDSDSEDETPPAS